MINAEIQDAINIQINQELASAYSYLGMAAYFQHENLIGFAHWCMMQYEEELGHARRLFDYVLDRDGRIKLESIAAPKSEFESPLEVFKTALAEERENTRSIDELYRRASSLNDHATISHLQWFVDEQVEEEKSVGETLSLVERAGTDPHALLYLNDRLGDRQPEDKGED